MVKILHLYYDLMNLYGEYGNIIVLCDNLKKNSIDFEVSRYSIDDVFDFDDFDFIYCGSGTEQKTELAVQDFIKRKESFNKALNNNKIILFTGSSILLLGNNGIGAFDYHIRGIDNRVCGDVICLSDKYKDIVGYINTSYIVESTIEPSIKVLKGDSFINNYYGLGFTKNNLLTINITGPLLIKNPFILKDIIIELGLSAKTDFVFQDTIDEYQYKSYQITLEQLKKRFN